MEAEELKGGPRLRRQIGLHTATALVVGETIAVGIFLTPAGMAKALGSPALLLAVWAVMGLMALSGALCYGELATRYPEAGGGYVYLREAYGPVAAFLYGWTGMLVVDPGVTAALAVGLASYAAYGLGVTAPAWVKVIAVGSIVLVAAVNVCGVRAGGAAMRWLTALKLGLLIFLPVWGFGRGLGDWSHFSPLVARRAGSAPLGLALAGSMVAAFFSFGGWWDLSKLAGEVCEPRRVLPRALARGVLVVTFLYVLTSAVFIYLVPPEGVDNGETFAAQAGEALFGPPGGQIFSAAVVVAVLGSLLGVMMAAPRVYFAMARDRLCVAAVAAVNPRFGTPARAILLQAALASLLVALGTFEEILSYFSFTVVIFLGLTVASLFVLRRRGGVPALYETPGYPATPLIFLALLAPLLVLLGGANLRQSMSGFAVVVAGLPFYYLIFRRGPRRGGARQTFRQADPH